MKKSFLTLAALLVASGASMAQFVGTSTGASYTGNSIPATKPRFYAYQAYPSPKYSENTCNTVFTQTLGGFDPNWQDATLPGNDRTAGALIYGGTIATIYAGTPCVAERPSFGFDLNATDLSLAANQKITFNYQSDAALSLVFQVKDQWYNEMLSTVPVTLLGDGAVHSISIDFSSNVLGTSDLSAITQVSFIYPSTTLSPAFGVSLSNIKLGSSVVTGVTDSEGILASANVFPNPSNGTTTITAELPSSADVKVSLMDMYGREVKVITEGNFNSINSTFDVSNLAKGVYTVNYQVNGKATKVQKLVVR